MLHTVTARRPQGGSAQVFHRPSGSRAFTLSVLLAASLAACSDRVAGPTGPDPSARSHGAQRSQVNVVYLVPSDRRMDPAARQNMRRAIAHLQLWYADQLGSGLSFDISKPDVQVVRTSHTANWYATNPNGSFELWFWWNALDDAFTATGGRFNDPDAIWIYYIDALPACGQVIGGTSHVALLAANDVRGLAGKSTVDPCSGQIEPDLGVCRWVGGLGHELGHAFGLPHPPGCDAPADVPCDTWALMYLGYLSYPGAHLTQADKLALESSPFFGSVRLPRGRETVTRG